MRGLPLLPGIGLMDTCMIAGTNAVINPTVYALPVRRCPWRQHDPTAAGRRRYRFARMICSAPARASVERLLAGATQAAPSMRDFEWMPIQEDALCRRS